ncbi:MAG: DUF4249 family protein [Saprospiraceae bacterium]
MIFVIVIAMYSCQSNIVYDLDHPPLDAQKIAIYGDLKAGEFPNIFISKTIDDVKSKKSLSEFILKDALVVLFENGKADTLKYNTKLLAYESDHTVQPGSRYIIVAKHPKFGDATSEEVICPGTPNLLMRNTKLLADTTQICSSIHKNKPHEYVLYSIDFQVDQIGHDLTYIYDYYDQDNLTTCDFYTGGLLGGDPSEGAIDKKAYQFNTSSIRLKGSRFKVSFMVRSKEFLYEYKTSDPLGAIETGLVSAGPLYSNIRGGLGIVRASNAVTFEF